MMSVGVEDEAVARIKLAEAGFDPDDCVTAVNPPQSARPKGVGHGSWKSITPMTHFCGHGDLPMCKYVFCRGGSTTRAGTSGEFWFPLYAAAHSGNLALCAWLFENGAHVDIRAKNSAGFRPLNKAVKGESPVEENTLEVIQWLLVNGSAQHDAGDCAPDILQDLMVDVYSLRGRRIDYVDYRPLVLARSEDVLKTRSCFQAFLMGTCPRSPAETSPRSSFYARLRAKLTEPFMDRTAPVQLLSGHGGVLKCIADFAGVVCVAKELRINQELVEQLPIAIQKNPAPYWYPAEHSSTTAFY